jgi:type I restriction enzyme S subunit
MNWHQVKMIDAAEINPCLPRNLIPKSSDLVTFLPMAAVGEDGIIKTYQTRPYGEVASGYTVFRKNDVLLAKITPCMENGKAALVNGCSTEVACGSTEFHVLRAREGIHPRYLFHLVWNEPFRRLAARNMTGSAGQKRVPKSFLETHSILLPHKNGKPDLDEQKRVADVLDKADTIRRKRQQALSLTDAFLRSVFLDMFGDPVTNPKGWPVKPLNEGVESFDGGKNVNPIDFPRRDGIRVLKVSAVTSGEYLESESKSFGEEFMVPADYIVKNGDLLISRANTAELVGAVAYVWNTSGYAMLPDKLWRFVWSKPAKIHPLFMLHMARSEHFRNQLILRATGSSGSMKNIGKVKMLEIPIPLPPYTLQERFAKITTRLHSQITSLSAALKQAENLSACLQQRAFRGEL